MCARNTKKTKTKKPVLRQIQN